MGYYISKKNKYESFDSIHHCLEKHNKKGKKKKRACKRLKFLKKLLTSEKHKNFLNLGLNYPEISWTQKAAEKPENSFYLN